MGGDDEGQHPEVLSGAVLHRGAVLAQVLCVSREGARGAGRVLTPVPGRRAANVLRGGRDMETAARAGLHVIAASEEWWYLDPLPQFQRTWVQRWLHEPATVVPFRNKAYMLPAELQVRGRVAAAPVDRQPLTYPLYPPHSTCFWGRRPRAGATAWRRRSRSRPACTPTCW